MLTCRSSTNLYFTLCVFFEPIILFFTSLFFPSFQFLNTRSHKGEKEKNPEQDKDSDPEEPSSEANLSLMDRTKHHAKAARDQHRKKTDTLLC